MQATRWPGATSRSAGALSCNARWPAGSGMKSGSRGRIGRIRDLALHQRLRFTVRIEGRHRGQQGAGVGMEGG
jgi:hypothetical protein